MAIAAAVAALLACAGALTAGVKRAAARAATAPPRCAGANLRPTTANLRKVNAATLCLVNRLRTAHGLAPVGANAELMKVAGGTAAGMVRGDYFADVEPSGRTPMSVVASTRYRPVVAVGQDIAWGTGADATPASVVAAWLASPPHREVMLSRQYTAAGVAATPAVPAVLHPEGAGATYVLELGARA